MKLFFTFCMLCFTSACFGDTYVGNTRYSLITHCDDGSPFFDKNKLERHYKFKVKNLGILEIALNLGDDSRPLHIEHQLCVYTNSKDTLIAADKYFHLFINKKKKEFSLVRCNDGVESVLIDIGTLTVDTPS